MLNVELPNSLRIRTGDIRADVDLSRRESDGIGMLSVFLNAQLRRVLRIEGNMPISIGRVEPRTETTVKMEVTVNGDHNASRIFEEILRELGGRILYQAAI